MLVACLIQELLVEDLELNHLLESYKSLCAQIEWIFFEQLSSTLPEKWLSLFVLPQRGMRFLLRAPQLPADLVYIGLEIPYADENRWVRIIIEIDDQSHEEKVHQNSERDEDFIIHL